jgi:hypothetical protein
MTFQDMHDHSVDHFKDIGLPSKVQEIIDGMLSVDNKVIPNEVMSKLKYFIVNDLPDSLQTGTNQNR